MKRFFRTGALLIVMCSLMAAGCDLTDDTREEIDQAAWAAKAPGITVLPAVYPGTGVVTPSGERFTVKQHIGSDVSFNLTNTEYAFIGWRAYPGDVRSRFDWSTLTARNEAGEELTPYTAHEALIESDPERPTSARLTARLSGGEIMLVPVVAPRPRVGFQPDGGSSTPAIVNSPIVLQFSAKVNPASFIWKWDAAGNPQYRNDENLFKNITITGKGNFGSGTVRNLEQFFHAPELDVSGTIMTFRFDMSKMSESALLYFTYVSVDLDPSISVEAAPESGEEVTLGTARHFEYFISNDNDEDGPVVTLMKASRSQYTFDEIATPVDAGDTIFIVATAYDAIDRTNLKNVTIKETYTPRGSTTSAEMGLTKSFTNLYYTPAYKTLLNQVEAIYLSQPSLIVIEYQLHDSAPDSTITLTILITDQSNKPSLKDSDISSNSTNYQNSTFMLTRKAQ